MGPGIKIDAANIEAAAKSRPSRVDVKDIQRDAAQ